MSFKDNRESGVTVGAIFLMTSIPCNMSVSGIARGTGSVNL
ncbi:hypothetical protein QWZ16_20285 [Vibrio ostreicida]|uniref:Uncharacterized protein n=1 Tax=Vibrio ostreicida TaxID=526588 RepID=A0ABT8C0R5_9VIBR|nr:hypothetical protein [Vibrio ostreicida]MDN3611933.1 hypothetical protein [Vibrio ostreicida]